MPRAIRVAAAAATAAPLRIVVVARLARVHHACFALPMYVHREFLAFNAISVLLNIFSLQFHIYLEIITILLLN